MAGMGRPPKDPKLRQRRNRVAGAAVLSAELVAEPVEIPPLEPARRKWHALTRAWWADAWRSPMAGEFVKADIHRLYMLAVLVDQFWKRPDAKLMSEIRLQGQCFGLTPLDRRRLQWEVARGEEAEMKRQRTTAPPPAPPQPAEDPRRFLQVVN